MYCYILVPGLSEKYRSGGLMVIRDVARLIEKIPGCHAKFVATEENNQEALSLGTWNPEPKTLYIVTWGPLVSEHIKLIRSRDTKARILYYAQSFGWKIKVQRWVPIICVSRYVMSQWALYSPENFIAYIPPPLQSFFTFQNKARDIDILVHTRKQNDYCLKKLLPALQTTNYKLQTIQDWIPQTEFADLLNRTKIFLYLTGTHKAGLFRRLPAEGFGLPALEAVACGALVGSNLLGGVTDFLTPGENCVELRSGDLDFDLKQICVALKNFQANERAAEEIKKHYSPEFVLSQWKKLLETI